MKGKRHTRTIVLWLISIGLLVGMIITFTPSLGAIGGGGGQNTQGTVQLLVNGEPIRESDVLRLRQNPLFTSVTEGQVGADLELLLVDTLVQNEVLVQAAAKNRVSNGAVAKEVSDFRSSRGVDGRKNDQAYLNLIGSAGYDDQGFRAYVKQTLREREFEDGLTKDVTVSDDEARAWYETHSTSYQSEERVKAREIVVDDADLAQDLLRQLIAGADFAELARENSQELADRDGALGAAAGETEPQPIGRPGMPTSVATPAFGLAGPGLTGVIEASGRYYIVSVEEYLPPAARAFDEVKDRVTEDALAAKRNEVVQAELERLRAAATVSVPDRSELSYDNPVVAKVGDVEITAADLARATYTNPQIQQALSPQTADLITSFFKPAVLGQLVDTEVAYQGSKTLDLALIGSKGVVAQAALDYVSRDAEASDQELRDYYEANKASYTIPAEAAATRVDFDTEAAATAFRAAVMSGDSVEDAAQAGAGVVTDLGTVKPGDLASALDTALFKTDAFEALTDGRGVSDVLVLSEAIPQDSTTDSTTDGTADGTADTPSNEDANASEGDAAEGTTTTNLAGESGDVPAATKDVYVILVADRTPERVRSFEEVSSQVEAAVLAGKRQKLRSDWLEEIRGTLTIENLLAQTGQPFVPTPATSEPTDGAPAADAPADAAPTDAAPADGGDGVEAAPEADPAAAPADGADDTAN